MGALTWPRCQGSSWKCLGTSSVHPTHPVLLTWEVTLGPGHEGDARLGSGFKVAAETSGSGTEACGEGAQSWFPGISRRNPGISARSEPPRSPPRNLGLDTQLADGAGGCPVADAD